MYVRCAVVRKCLVAEMITLNRAPPRLLPTKTASAPRRRRRVAAMFRWTKSTKASPSPPIASSASRAAGYWGASAPQSACEAVGVRVPSGPRWHRPLLHRLFAASVSQGEKSQNRLK